MAQTIIELMEDIEEYTGTSSELHGKLEGVAESLGVSVVLDKAWPKSARWLWGGEPRKCCPCWSLRA